MTNDHPGAGRRPAAVPARAKAAAPVKAPERNRVTPMGDIVAIPLRGAWTGNRGILHEGREIVRFHASDLWITCALEFRGRYHPDQWLPRHYTFLYFHDEAVSFAAGHRPCAECRYGDYRAYQRAWAKELGVPLPSAKEMNQRLHAERIIRGTHRRRTHALPWAELPDGTFVSADGAAAVIVGDQLVPWTHAGYGPPRARPGAGAAEVITPPSTVAVLRAGYPVQIDDSARRGAASLAPGRRPAPRPRLTASAPARATPRASAARLAASARPRLTTTASARLTASAPARATPRASAALRRPTWRSG